MARAKIVSSNSCLAAHFLYYKPISIERHKNCMGKNTVGLLFQNRLSYLMNPFGLDDPVFCSIFEILLLSVL